MNHSEQLQSLKKFSNKTAMQTEVQLTAHEVVGLKAQVGYEFSANVSVYLSIVMPDLF